MSKFVYTSYYDVESSAIYSVAHNDYTGEMVVTFKKGNETLYKGVPPHVVFDFVTSDSVGGYYNHHISGQYTSEPCDFNQFVNYDDEVTVDEVGQDAEDAQVMETPIETAHEPVVPMTHVVHYTVNGESRQSVVPGNTPQQAMVNFKEVAQVANNWFGPFEVELIGVMISFE